MPDQPTIWELSRRIDAQGTRMDEGFRDLNARLSDLPTEKTLLAYLATRDAEMRALTESHAALSRRLDAEATARKEGDRELEQRTTEGKRLTWQVTGIMAASVLGLLAFVAQVGGLG